MHKKLLSVAVVATMTLAVTSAHAEKWDMPMAYAASNFHSEMGVVFADKVRDYTGGKIDITIHAQFGQTIQHAAAQMARQSFWILQIEYGIP